MNYFVHTLRHKYWVFRYGLKVGCPIWRLITHDLSKFMPSEYPHYQRQTFGDKGDQRGINQAWCHHQNVNDHHWEWWIIRTAYGRATPKLHDNDSLPMTEDAVLEMVSDWLGASHVFGSMDDINNWPWLDTYWPRISKRMHGETKSMVMRILFRMGRTHLCP